MILDEPKNELIAAHPGWARVYRRSMQFTTHLGVSQRVYATQADGLLLFKTLWHPLPT